MLEHYPVLKDRLQALAMFSGIAIAAVAGFELIITGGFDFALPGREVREVAPSAYVTVDQRPWSSQRSYTPLASTEPMFSGEDAGYTGEDLAGGYDDAPQGDYPLPSEDEIYREIETLYERPDSGAAPSSEYTDEYETGPDPKGDDLSASGSASPW